MTSAPGHIKEDETEANINPPSSPPRVSLSMAIAMKAGSTSPTRSSFEDSFWEAEGQKMLSFGKEEEGQQQQTSGQSTEEEQKIVLVLPKEKMTGCAAVAKEGTTKPEKKTTASQAAVATEPSACTANQLAAEERSEDDALVTAAKRYAAQALLLIPTIIVLQLFLFLVVMVGELPVPEEETEAASNRRKRQPKKTTTKTQPKGTASTKKLVRRTPSWRLRIRPPPALDAKQAILQTLWPRVRRLNATSPQQWQAIVAGLVQSGKNPATNQAAAYVCRYLVGGAAAQTCPLTMARRRNRRAIDGNAIQNVPPSSASTTATTEEEACPSLPTATIRRRSSLNLIDTGGTPRSTLASPGAIAPTPNLLLSPPATTGVLRVRRSSKSRPSRPAPTAQQQRLRVRTSTLDLRDLRQRFRAGY